MPKLSRQRSGVTGVYYACAELSRRGYLALGTYRNEGSIDIVVRTPDGRLATLQVKTQQRRDTYFLPGKPARHPTNHAFVFVVLGALNPEFHIVPASAVRRQTVAFKRPGGERFGLPRKAVASYVSQWEIVSQIAR